MAYPVSVDNNLHNSFQPAIGKYNFFLFCFDSFIIHWFIQLITTFITYVVLFFLWLNLKTVVVLTFKFICFGSLIIFIY